MTARRVVREIRRCGGRFVRQEGSHAMYRLGRCVTVVPMHSGDLATGTLRAIERDLAPCVGERRWLVR
jgi:predicted RNA binding protein YcfA (HicA-like mRNA interferase family)